MKKYFIYLTTNLINGKQYIGKHYGKENDSYLGSGNNIRDAIIKYGKENFKRDILYFSEDNEENNLKEQEFIKTYNAVEDRNFYNISKGGDGGDIFSILPLEQQEQLRKQQSVRNSGKGNPMYGKHHTEETKNKIRQVDKSYMQTEEYRQNMSKAVSGELNGMYGKKHSEESKKRMSENKIGKKLGSENGNAKGINAYEDKEMTKQLYHFNTIKEALEFVGTKPTDYSGISKSIKLCRPYKKYYWKREV